jgi:hypothetical protein
MLAVGQHVAGDLLLARLLLGHEHQSARDEGAARLSGACTDALDAFEQRGIEADGDLGAGGHGGMYQSCRHSPSISKPPA